MRPAGNEGEDAQMCPNYSVCCALVFPLQLHVTPLVYVSLSELSRPFPSLVTSAGARRQLQPRAQRGGVLHVFLPKMVEPLEPDQRKLRTQSNPGELSVLLTFNAEGQVFTGTVTFCSTETSF